MSAAMTAQSECVEFIAGVCDRDAQMSQGAIESILANGWGNETSAIPSDFSVQRTKDYLTLASNHRRVCAGTSEELGFEIGNRASVGQLPCPLGESGTKFVKLGMRRGGRKWKRVVKLIGERNERETLWERHRNDEPTRRINLENRVPCDESFKRVTHNTREMSSGALPSADIRSTARFVERAVHSRAGKKLQVTVKLHSFLRASRSRCVWFYSRRARLRSSDVSDGLPAVRSGGRVFADS